MLFKIYSNNTPGCPHNVWGFLDMVAIGFPSHEQLLVWCGCLQLLVHIQSSRYFLVLGALPARRVEVPPLAIP